MKVIVDANIVFSAILNSNGKIGDLLINSRSHLQFIAPDFLRAEILKHHSRLCKISGLSSEEVNEACYHIYQDITFISAEQIKESCWISAEKLVVDIDQNDTPYVAYARHFRCKIWSGDKHLIKGLAKKGSQLVVTTNELYQWREDKLKHRSG